MRYRLTVSRRKGTMKRYELTIERDGVRCAHTVDAHTQGEAIGAYYAFVARTLDGPKVVAAECIDRDLFRNAR